jgi:hypothetical protein
LKSKNQPDFDAEDYNKQKIIQLEAQLKQVNNKLIEFSFWIKKLNS